MIDNITDIIIKYTYNKIILTKTKESDMAIGTAVERNGWVYVYDEKGHQLTTLHGSLHGFTGSTVSVKRNYWIYVYDEKGHHQNTFHC